MSPTATYRRDRQTSRTTSGVRINPGHWASISVHAFHRWTGETTLVTWCGIEVELGDGGRLTTDIITCVQCPVGSMQAFRGLQ